GEWPSAQQGLVEQVLLIAVGHRLAVYQRLLFSVEPAPAAQRGSPLVGNLREHVDAGADVLAALGVVRGGGEQRVRPALESIAVVRGAPVARQAEALLRP